MFHTHRNNDEPFRTVQSQIGRFLADNQNALDIIDNGETFSENVFECTTSNESWKRI